MAKQQLQKKDQMANTSKPEYYYIHYLHILYYIIQTIIHVHVQCIKYNISLLYILGGANECSFSEFDPSQLLLGK